MIVSMCVPGGLLWEGDESASDCVCEGVCAHRCVCVYQEDARGWEVSLAAHGRLHPLPPSTCRDLQAHLVLKGDKERRAPRWGEPPGCWEAHCTALPLPVLTLRPPDASPTPPPPGGVPCPPYPRGLGFDPSPLSHPTHLGSAAPTTPSSAIRDTSLVCFRGTLALWAPQGRQALWVLQAQQESLVLMA